ncbi:hypothetical protein C7J99_08835 [Brevibacillus brevis]|nr:hypothetical protein C7J99_08835 [Brevibacillus brevis]GEC93850.1 hypothetical protein BBR01nite_61810 [Brevibacillus brevis]
MPLFAIIWFLSVAACIYMGFMDDSPSHADKWIGLFAIATTKMMWSDLKRWLALRSNRITDLPKGPN